MNTKTLGSLTIAALLLTACSNEEWPETVATNGVLKATVEGSHSGSRAGFDKNGAFFWSTVDAIGVTTTGDPSKFTSLNLTTGGGTANATFEGTITGEIGKYAIYPNNSGHSIDANNNLVYNFPTEYTYDKVDTDFFVTQGEGNSFNPAMFGEIKEGNVKLKHLGGVLCIKIPNMPVESGKLELTADKRITGNFTVAITDGEMKCLANETGTSGNNTVTINFTGATVNSPGVFYVPVPIGTYNLTIKVAYGTSDTPTTIEAGEYTINRCDLKKIDLAAITCEKELKRVAAEGGEYTLFADVRGDFVISATDRVTINLNEHTITNKTGDTFTVNFGSSLTINGNGTVDNISHQKACIYNNGMVELNGGTYTRSKENGKSAEDAGGNSYYNILNHGTMTIYEGVTVSQTGHFSSMIANGYYSWSSTKPRNGYVSGTNHENPSLTIKGGTFTGALNTIKNDDHGILTIEGGTFTNNTQTTIMNHHIATISGGTFNASTTANDVIYNCACVPTHDIGKLTISGGSFTGNFSDIPTEGVTSQISVTGGTFSDPNVLQYLGENANVQIAMTKDEDSKGFKTQEGQKVEIDMGGHTLTLTDPTVGSTGTETNSCQLLKGSTVTFKNGTLTSQNTYLVIQNYCNLTLDGVTLDTPKASYSISNNNGVCHLENSTINAKDGGYAFDVFSFSSYEGVTVNVFSCTINGKVEFSGNNGEQNGTLKVKGGTMNGDLVVNEAYVKSDKSNISIANDVNFGDGVTGWNDYINK